MKNKKQSYILGSTMLAFVLGISAVQPLATTVKAETIVEDEPDEEPDEELPAEETSATEDTAAADPTETSDQPTAGSETTADAAEQPNTDAAAGTNQPVDDTVQKIRFKFWYRNYEFEEMIPDGKDVILYKDQEKTEVYKRYTIKADENTDEFKTLTELTSVYDKDKYTLSWEHAFNNDGNLEIWPVYTATVTKFYNYHFKWVNEETGQGLPWYVPISSILSKQDKDTLTLEEVEAWINTLQDGRIKNGRYDYIPTDGFGKPLSLIFKGFAGKEIVGTPNNSGKANTNVGYWEVKDLQYRVSYAFESDNPAYTVPEEVLALLPEAGDYDYQAQVDAAVPSQNKVATDQGVWTFKGYKADRIDSLEEDTTFTGVWTLAPNQSTQTEPEESKPVRDQGTQTVSEKSDEAKETKPTKKESKKDKKDKTVKTSAAMNAALFAGLSGLALTGATVLKKRKK